MSGQSAIPQGLQDREGCFVRVRGGRRPIEAVGHGTSEVRL